MRAWIARYAAGADLADPRLSPARSRDLADLPPLLLQAGGNEVLLDDSVLLAGRAREAGVDVVLEVVAGVPHVFQVWAGTVPEAPSSTAL